MTGPGSGSRERGSATALTLMLGVGLIVLPVVVLVLSLPAWEQRAVDAQDAARSAARALATAGSWPAGVAAANLAAQDALQGRDLTPADLSLQYSGSLVADGSVTVSVTVRVPVGEVPGLGAVGTLHYTASSTEHVDSYRSS